MVFSIPLVTRDFGFSSFLRLHHISRGVHSLQQSYDFLVMSDKDQTGTGLLPSGNSPTNSLFFPIVPIGENVVLVNGRAEHGGVYMVEPGGKAERLLERSGPPHPTDATGTAIPGHTAVDRERSRTGQWIARSPQSLTVREFKHLL